MSISLYTGSTFGAHLITFVLMFCIGLGSRWPSLKDPESLKNYAFSYVKLSLKDNKYVFTFGSKDKILYWYDIDKNVLHEKPNPSINDTFLESDLMDQLLKPGPIHAASLLVAQEILGTLKAKALNPAKTFIASVLGGISGYSLGRWVAVRVFLPSFDSPQIIDIVKSKDTWIGWKKYVLENIFREIDDMISDIENDGEQKIYNEALDRVLMSMKDEQDDSWTSNLNLMLRVYTIMKYNQRDFDF